MSFNKLSCCLLALLTLSSLLGSCTASQDSADFQSSVPNQDTQGNAASTKRLKVVATILPTYLFTQAVAGDAAEVEILIEPGTEVHEYQSTPDDVQAIAQADVVVENGLGLEDFLESTIASAENSDLTVIDASAGIEPVGELSPVVSLTDVEAGHEHEIAEAEHNFEAADHAEAGATSHTEEEHAASEAQDGAHTHAENPHVWLDPLLAVQQVETIRDGLIAADPQNQPIYEANAAAYINQLQALDRQFQERLQAFGDRSFITFHDAFPYLANRYNLEQVAIVAIPEDSLTPGDIQKTIEIVKELEVKALFGESGVDNKLLQSLSQDLNIELGTLDSLESGDRDPQYYFTVMEQNLNTLMAAFESTTGSN